MVDLVFQEMMHLKSVPGYLWTNSFGQRIDTVKCDFFDFGGIYESIKLDYEWECAEGYYKLADSSCKGLKKISLYFRRCLNLLKLLFILQHANVTQEGPFYQHAMKMEFAKSVVTMLSVINVMIVRRICLDFLTVESVSKHLLQIVIIQKSK